MPKKEGVRDLSLKFLAKYASDNLIDRMSDDMSRQSSPEICRMAKYFFDTDTFYDDSQPIPFRDLRKKSSEFAEPQNLSWENPPDRLLILDILRKLFAQQGFNHIRSSRALERYESNIDPTKPIFTISGCRRGPRSSLYARHSSSDTTRRDRLSSVSASEMSDEDCAHRNGDDDDEYRPSCELTDFSNQSRTYSTPQNALHLITNNLPANGGSFRSQSNVNNAQGLASANNVSGHDHQAPLTQTASQEGDENSTVTVSPHSYAPDRIVILKYGKRENEHAAKSTAQYSTSPSQRSAQSRRETPPNPQKASRQAKRTGSSTIPGLEPKRLRLPEREVIDVDAIRTDRERVSRKTTEDMKNASAPLNGPRDPQPRFAATYSSQFKVPIAPMGSAAQEEDMSQEKEDQTQLETATTPPLSLEHSTRKESPYQGGQSPSHSAEHREMHSKAQTEEQGPAKQIYRAPSPTQMSDTSAGLKDRLKSPPSTPRNAENREILTGVKISDSMIQKIDTDVQIRTFTYASHSRLHFYDRWPTKASDVLLHISFEWLREHLTGEISRINILLQVIPIQHLVDHPTKETDGVFTETHRYAVSKDDESDLKWLRLEVVGCIKMNTNCTFKLLISPFR
ncbi:hypothetical protein L228DRAFT_240988 [Xylona heveae TC161]|uniref:Uncharacterized protein n=1 Tax=Xylona heveae (strain CBS 132557 / TC161) TaxID=1328760 RepID=A0A165AH88_XYLHT|nr:hypothetical protein L228DRAFT_240988 [Xylona heveae TC161]KZF20469.1 hypothetical protein L228DRAFT_240988 [Xylona heveae TC161]